MKGRILVIDDDKALGVVLTGLLEQAGYDATWVDSAESGLQIASRGSADAVITDLRMPGMDGMALLREIGARVPELPVIMITAHGTIADAVAAMKAGARDFLTKPFDKDEIIYTLERALAALNEAPPPQSMATPDGIVVASDGMKRCMDDVRRAAQSTANVLLLGETGTGKSALARAIHGLSARSRGPFVEVNATTVPGNLLESELFGYEKGAFTGAAARKPGRVELADGGTFFLDEIGDVEMPLQPKLLRFVQSKEFERLGGTRSEKADVRFISATLRDLKARIDEGSFREDLYYRVSVIPISIPALRERRDDVEPLARHFLKRQSEANGREGLSFSADAIARLREHAWPGNVRELENIVERCVVFTDGRVIERADVERELHRLGGATKRGEAAAKTGSLDAQRSDAEREAILDALARAKDNRTQAARLLGISRRTLYNKLGELGIKD